DKGRRRRGHHDDGRRRGGRQVRPAAVDAQGHVGVAVGQAQGEREVTIRLLEATAAEQVVAQVQRQGQQPATARVLALQSERERCLGRRVVNKDGRQGAEVADANADEELGGRRRLDVDDDGRRRRGGDDEGG